MTRRIIIIHNMYETNRNSLALYSLYQLARSDRSSRWILNISFVDNDMRLKNKLTSLSSLRLWHCLYCFYCNGLIDLFTFTSTINCRFTLVCSLKKLLVDQAGNELAIERIEVFLRHWRLGKDYFFSHSTLISCFK